MFQRFGDRFLLDLRLVMSGHDIAGYDGSLYNGEALITGASRGLGFALARRLARTPSERLRMWLRSIFPRRWNLSKRYPRLSASPLWPICYLLLNGDRLYHVLRVTLRGR